jgi:hypothetical protein
MGFLGYGGGAVMSPLGEETVEASLARINAGLQSKGSSEVFEQYKQGVYLNKPFGRPEHAHEVARALGEGQGYARVERGLAKLPGVLNPFAVADFASTSPIGRFA